MHVPCFTLLPSNVIVCRMSMSYFNLFMQKPIENPVSVSSDDEESMVGTGHGNTVSFSHFMYHVL